MKRSRLLIGFVGVLGVMFSLSVSAQDPKLVAAAGGSQYVISARAGGVNYVHGTVNVSRKNSTGGLLVSGDTLEIGDKVTTSADGRAEILLNPGSYLRLGGNSTFEFVTTSLDNLRLKLTSGSAIFEVFAAEDFQVSVATPRSDLMLTRSGVFRVDVQTDGGSRLSVIKGKAFVGANASTEVKAGRSVLLGDGRLEVARFRDDIQDEFTIWSKERAKEVNKLNAKLQRRQLRNILMNSYNARGWNIYDSFGLWVLDPVWRRWCFLPFGSGWASPYGWSYYYDFWSLRMPYWMYRDQWPAGSNQGGNGTGTGTNPARRGPIENRGVVPPFQRVQTSGAANGDTIFSRRVTPVDVDSPPIMRTARPTAEPTSAPAPPITPPAPNFKKDDN